MNNSIVMSFSALGLCSELLQSLEELAYTTPSPIQVEAIPAVLKQQDLIAIAHTGTGKTASFSLPMLQLLSQGAHPEANYVRALVITPTRELAAQVGKSIEKYSANLRLRTFAVYGGVRIEPQIFELQKGIDILVATPGRLLDLYNQQAINFERLEILVLDEADRMLDLGFIDDISLIQKLLPSKRQTLLFSATFSKDIKSLAKSMLQSPVILELAPAQSNINAITQKLHPVDKVRKSELLIQLINASKWRQILVFIRTKRSADSLRDELESIGISAESIHANRTQRARTLALDGFKSGNIKVLVATDIASRGIDVSELPCVINYDLPYVPEDYVHRIGRTGRASANGLAISFFSDDEEKQLKSIERMLGREFKREIVPGFAPTEKAPLSLLEEALYGNFEADTKPKRRGKSKQRKARR